ncbi:MAG: hypothetical protein J6N53_16050 [Lachnospiraceae bacterium]|nr:hypothetical protein [Lachnospiraceae bacterium]
MKKMKKALLGVAAAMTFCLCGCSTDAIPDLSEEDMKQVEEYAAHLLLKHSANYEMTTVTMEEMAAQRAELERRAEVQAQIAVNKAMNVPDPEEVSGAGEGGSSSGETATAETKVYTDIDDFFEEDALEINYVGYEVCTTYPADAQNNDWQGVVRATEGNSLIVCYFSVKNTGSGDALLDMAGKSAKFNFRINNSVSKPALRTLRLDELSMYRETIPAGGSAEAVLIIETDQSTAASLTSLKMIMRYGDKRSELSLL